MGMEYANAFSENTRNGPKIFFGYLYCFLGKIESDFKILIFV